MIRCTALCFSALAMFALNASTASAQSRDSLTEKHAKPKPIGDSVVYKAYQSANPRSLSANRWIRKLKGDAMGNYRIRSKAPKTASLDNGLVYVSRQIDSRGSVKRMSLLTACQSKSGALHLTDSVGRLEHFDRKNISRIIQVTLTECADDTSSRSATSSDSASTNDDSARAQQSAPPPKLASIATAPGKGIALRQIKTVLYRLDSYTGAGGFLEIDEDIYILLKDGMAYKNPRVPISDVDVELSKQHEPKRWTTWRKGGKDFQIRTTRKGKATWKTLVGFRALKPQKRGKAFRGSFKYARASGSMYYGATVSKAGLKLNRNGTYEGWSSSQSDSSTLSTTTFIVQYCNKDGGKVVTSTSSPGFTAGTKARNSKCANDSVGSYKIDGYTIQFTTKSGLVTRLPFYELSNKRLMIGDKGYRRQ